MVVLNFLTLQEKLTKLDCLENKMHLNLLQNLPEKLAKGSHFYLFLKTHVNKLDIFQHVRHSRYMYFRFKNGVKTENKSCRALCPRLKC